MSIDGMGDFVKTEKTASEFLIFMYFFSMHPLKQAENPK